MEELVKKLKIAEKYNQNYSINEIIKILEQKDQRIAELEQDLEFTTKTANELIEIKHKLEQELAELKEKDNYHLRYELAGADETIANLKKQLEEKDKDKTQLAIQELEKVKEICDKKFDWWEKSEFEGDIYDKLDVSNAYLDVSANVEEIIKELKGE